MGKTMTLTSAHGKFISLPLAETDVSSQLRSFGGKRFKGFT